MELLTSRQVCEILKIRPGTLYNWVYLRKIKVVKLSQRLLRFKIEDIIDLIEKQKSNDIW